MPLAVHKKPAPRLLTLAELARTINLPHSRANELFKSGKLRPDFVGGRMFLFLEARAEELALKMATDGFDAL